MSALLSLILCLATSQSAAPQRESDRAVDGFVGPVKKVTQVWTPVSGGNYPKGSKCRQLLDEYDETGRIMRYSVYPGTCGEDEIREDYKYARDGSRTALVQEIRGPNSSLPPPPPAPANPGRKKGPLRKMLKHDGSGRLVEESTVFADGSVAFKTGFTHDAKGRLVETTGYNEEGGVTSRRVFAYSADERVPSSFVYYGPDGEVAERTTYSDYEFNSHGDWTRRKETTDEPFTHRGVSHSRRSVSITLREIEYYTPK